MTNQARLPYKVQIQLYPAIATLTLNNLPGCNVPPKLFSSESYPDSIMIMIARPSINPPAVLSSQFDLN